MKTAIEKTKNFTPERQLMILLILFYLLDENTNIDTVASLFKYLLQIDFWPYKKIARLDRLDFRLEISGSEDIDRVHNWLQENRLTVIKADPDSNLERLLIAEKFRKDRDISVLQAYTDKTKDIDLDFIYETLIGFLKQKDEPKKYKLAPTARKALQQAINNFLVHYRQSELLSPLEKILKLGYCAINTNCCQIRREKQYVNCPTCNGIIRRVL